MSDETACNARDDATRQVDYPSHARWPLFGCPICGTGVWALRRHLKVRHGA